MRCSTTPKPLHIYLTQCTAPTASKSYDILSPGLHFIFKNTQLLLYELHDGENGPGRLVSSFDKLRDLLALLQAQFLSVDIIIQKVTIATLSAFAYGPLCGQCNTNPYPQASL
jgi:hypothetical protein